MKILVQQISSAGFEMAKMLVPEKFNWKEEVKEGYTVQILSGLFRTNIFYSTL